MFLFPVFYAVGAVQAFEEENAFRELLRSLPEDQAAGLRAARSERRKEEIIERRHQEMCDAIRSTSFWRFGSRR